MKTLFLSFIILTLGWNTGVDLHQEKVTYPKNDELKQVHTFQKNMDQHAITMGNRSELPKVVDKEKDVGENPEVVEEKQNGEKPEVVDKEKQKEVISEAGKAQNKVNGDAKPKNKRVEEENKHEVSSPSKEDLIHTAQTFMDELLQPFDENNKVKHFHTKQELVSHVSSYVTEEVAASYVNLYFEEKEDGLYIIPMCLNPWITDEQPFTLTEVDNKHYRLSQSNKSDMHGIYTIHLLFKLNNERWIIESVDFER